MPFANPHPLGETATFPLTGPGGRLALSFLLVGPGLRRRHFVPATRRNAPSGVSDYRFQDTVCVPAHRWPRGGAR
jgi:hypothetical protein